MKQTSFFVAVLVAMLTITSVADSDAAFPMQATKPDNKRVASFIEKINGANLEMVNVPAGEFLMGSPENQGDTDEHPQHQVKLSSFYIGKYELTQKQWRAIAQLPKVKIDLLSDPSNFSGDELPVENISWYEAEEFCARLSKATGKVYRLPTEAEWEYACRSGTTTTFFTGERLLSTVANIKNDLADSSTTKRPDLKGTVRVGSLSVANHFGLYDTYGNVWEWCADAYHDSYVNAPRDGSVWRGSDEYRILRGGSWISFPVYCRSANRFKFSPNTRDNDIGFRVVATMAKQ